MAGNSLTKQSFLIVAELLTSPEKYCIYDDGEDFFLCYIDNNTFYKHDFANDKRKEIYLGELGNMPSEIVIEEDNPRRITDENIVVLAWGTQTSAISYNPINDMNNEFVAARFINHYGNIINASHRILVQWNYRRQNVKWRMAYDY